MLSFRVNKDLEIRLQKEEDAPHSYAVIEANRDYLRQWIPRLDGVRSVETALAVIRKSLQGFANNEGFAFGMWYKDEFVGNVAYTYFDRANRKTEIAYWLSASHQGMGLVTASTRVLVDYAFEEKGMHRVIIQCATGNIRSRAIPERLGFTLEGVLREGEWLHDHFSDTAVYGLLASEWKQAKAV